MSKMLKESCKRIFDEVFNKSLQRIIIIILLVNIGNHIQNTNNSNMLIGILGVAIEAIGYLLMIKPIQTFYE